MNTANDDRLGAVKISDDVIAVCIMNAVLRTKGVSDLSGGFSDNFSKNILGKDPLYKGIKFSQTEDTFNIDIFVIVNYGFKIPEIAWDIQKNVKSEVEQMTDYTVNTVNIHVQGVDFQSEEE